MPNESKLVLANAADIQPDVALGVSTNVPYELAIRNALYDLRSFPDFDSFIRYLFARLAAGLHHQRFRLCHTGNTGFLGDVLPQRHPRFARITRSADLG